MRDAPPPRETRERVLRALNRAALYALLVFAVGLFAAPLVTMLSTSVKPSDQLFDTAPSLLPDPPSQTFSFMAEIYSDAWNNEIVNFPLALRNSLYVCTISVVAMTLSSAIVAFGLSRIQWRGRGIAFAIILATMMVPFPILLSSLYVVFRELGWIGTFRPLWVPALFGGPFQIFLLRQFFMTIPKSLDEAATIDGCSDIGVFFRIILPLAKPALAVVALFQFVYAWNDFLAPLVFLNHQDQFTLALGLQLYQSQQGNTPWNQLMAATTLITLPTLVLFVLTQRTFVEGIATQGMKG